MRSGVSVNQGRPGGGLSAQLSPLPSPPPPTLPKPLRSLSCCLETRAERRGHGGINANGLRREAAVQARRQPGMRILSLLALHGLPRAVEKKPRRNTFEGGDGVARRLKAK